MNTLILGNGFVASHLPYPKIKDRVETNSQQIKSLIETYKPDCLINTIGFCGNPTIDQCEKERDKTLIANTLIPSLLAVECHKRGIYLIHIGSGCIFNGSSPHGSYGQNTLVRADLDHIDLGWCEIDSPNPQSYYARTKYFADQILNEYDNVLNLRIRMPLSTKHHPRNLINKLLGYQQIIDIPNSITFMEDFVQCVEFMLEKRPSGIFHVVNPQPLTAVQIMQEYRGYDLTHKFEIITKQQLDQITVAKRSNCILDSTKLTNLGFTMKPSHTALRQCVFKYVNQIQ